MKESITLKDVFAVTERESGTEGAKKWWTKVGIGFVNRDDSISVVLDALPLTGRLYIRDRRPNTHETTQPAFAKATAGERRNV